MHTNDIILEPQVAVNLTQGDKMSVQPMPDFWQKQLGFELVEYKRTRESEPRFFYNEVEARGQALARLQPILDNFLNSHTDLAIFVKDVGTFSRVEQARLRGLQTGQHWRLNATGHLLLETMLNQAQKTNHLNQTQNLLQKSLELPESLDEASSKIEEIAHLLQDFSNSSETNSILYKGGLVPYLLSYFWALQSSNWPILTSQIRLVMQKLNLLDPINLTKLPAEAYSHFYIKSHELSRNLELGMGELQSFLSWLASRQLGNTSINLSTRRRSSANSKIGRNTRLHQNLKRLGTLLEPVLKTNLSPTLRIEPESGYKYSNSLAFVEPFQNFRLGIWTNQNRHNLLEGVYFSDYDSLMFSEEVKKTVVRLVQQFLEGESGYKFYPSAPSFAKEFIIPEPKNLFEEFSLLRELPSRNNVTKLVQTLLSNWVNLYRLAQQLTSSLEVSAKANSETTDRLEEVNLYDNSPSLSAQENFKVAEALTSYEVDKSQFSDTVTNQSGINKSFSYFKPPELTEQQVEDLIGFIQSQLIITREKIVEILTHLEAGREILLVGPPGSGKTRLARLLAGQLGSANPGSVSAKEANNYTLATANAEWTIYDTIGGIKPNLDEAGQNNGLSYHFEPGVVSSAALVCESSLLKFGRPHYLIIDEFNRANQERAFGELFTILEYRDRPLLPARLLGRAEALYLPPSFRIIGTMNADDKNSLFDTGFALRRRFAIVEIEVPTPAEERRYLPRSVQNRLPHLDLLSNGTFADPVLNEALDIVVDFAASVRVEPNSPANTGKSLGTALLIEVLVFCAVAMRYYVNSLEALEDAIIGNLLPQLERSPLAINRALMALSQNPKLAQLKKVHLALEKMKNTGYY